MCFISSPPSETPPPPTHTHSPPPSLSLPIAPHSTAREVSCHFFPSDALGLAVIFIRKPKDISETDKKRLISNPKIFLKLNTLKNTPLISNPKTFLKLIVFPKDINFMKQTKKGLISNPKDSSETEKNHPAYPLERKT